MTDSMIFSGRMYHLDSISFLDEIRDCYRKADNHRLKLSQPFMNSIHLKWGDVTVTFNYHVSNRTVCIIASDWIMNATIVMTVPSKINLSEIIVHGDMYSFEKWELMQKLKNTSNNGSSDDLTYEDLYER